MEKLVAPGIVHVAGEYHQRKVGNSGADPYQTQVGSKEEFMWNGAGLHFGDAHHADRVSPLNQATFLVLANRLEHGHGKLL